MSCHIASLLCRVSPLAVLSLFTGFSLPAAKTALVRDDRGSLVTVHLDIKPGSCPNPINVDPGDSMEYETLELIDGAMVSVIPVSVLGNKFDVEQVSLSSVNLSLSGNDDEGIVVYPIQLKYTDTGTPFVGQQCECHALAGDGILDLSLKFDKQAVIDAFGLAEEPNGTFIELQVTGLVKGGESEFRGRDCIRVVNH